MESAIKYKLYNNIFTFNRLLDDQTVIISTAGFKQEVFWTATSNMKDFIANITSIEQNKCSVKGLYYGRIVDVKNIKIVDYNIKNIGQRIMVTEHIDVSGKLELIATTKRIICPINNVNFINIGTSYKYKRIDIYNGETREIG